MTTLIKLQAAVRGLKARKIFCIKKVAVRKLQYFIRKHICEKVNNPKGEIEDERQMGLIPSVIKLQAAIRRFMARRIFLKNKKAPKSSADINQENKVGYEIQGLIRQPTKQIVEYILYKGSVVFSNTDGGGCQLIAECLRYYIPPWK